jgi:ABC-type sugar transport system ATPase subunit
VPEDRRQQGIMALISMTENIGITNLDTLSRASLVSGAKELTLCKRGIGLLNIKPTNPAIKVGSLSGGNQQKVVLGNWLMRAEVLMSANRRPASTSARRMNCTQRSRIWRSKACPSSYCRHSMELTRLSNRIIVLREGASSRIQRRRRNRRSRAARPVGLDRNSSRGGQHVH